MLHSLQVVLCSFNLWRAKVKRPKIHIINIATRGPPVIPNSAAKQITRNTFNAINAVNKVILLKGKFTEQVAH